MNIRPIFLMSTALIAMSSSSVFAESDSGSSTDYANFWTCSITWRDAVGSHVTYGGTSQSYQSAYNEAQGNCSHVLRQGAYSCSVTNCRSS